VNGPPDWEGALCREHYPDLWFPEAGLGHANDWRTPKALCRTCPLVSPCLEYALATRQDYGVWGGTTERERRELRRARRRAS
jgi:WhiB family redox-sensing transcriptional regulator